VGERAGAGARSERKRQVYGTLSRSVDVVQLAGLFLTLPTAVAPVSRVWRGFLRVAPLFQFLYTCTTAAYGDAVSLFY
jgi:hypothetical protein